MRNPLDNLALRSDTGQVRNGTPDAKETNEMIKRAAAKFESTRKSPEMVAHEKAVKAALKKGAK